MFPRLRLLLLCSGVPMLIGLAIAWIVGMLAEGVGRYEIHFGAAADGSALACARRLDEIGEAKLAVSLVDLRFMVSSVELIRYDGRLFPLTLDQDGAWQQRNVALIDLEDATGRCEGGTVETRRVIRGSAPKGNYRGVRFMLGRPAGVDLADPAFAALLRAGGWQPGTPAENHTLSIELASAGTPEHLARQNPDVTRIVLHMSRSVCVAGAPCAAVDQVQVTLSDFQPERHVIVAEMGGLAAKALVGGDPSLPTLTCDPGATDVMCLEVLQNLGFAIGTQTGRPQLFFTVQGRK